MDQIIMLVEILYVRSSKIFVYQSVGDDALGIMKRINNYFFLFHLVVKRLKA
jgi:hypothetical protein